ncbi:Polyadenylate-binding protein, cytoplasmic and nuclear [Erysiphe neolycopersici]|uniref:Polyadenylate-binding protein, cytoplasmic and nuclear n=1 Tax=Erysiphe neolycopersici TaxID=212602 RepID=A0A420I2L3_9PEZI|nr:Polyadenylate-binding protein, cytoplasmic and nuclear [Erysiphe neolycopersici]
MMSTLTNASLPSQSITSPGHGHGICCESSPASTYGSSIVSNYDCETPRTPNNEGILLRKLSKLKISTKSKSIEDYSPTFIRNSIQSDDPFTTNCTTTISQSQGFDQRTTRKVTKCSSNIEDWNSGSSTGNSTSLSTSQLAIQTNRSTQHGKFSQNFVSPASSVNDSDTLPVNPQDAQAIYPPSSCVFVANLLQSENDEALVAAVLEVFRKFGTVFVKIRRDAKHMPFAFCQYTNDENAELAIKNGRGILIKGRPCRCEKAKAHRLFFFERKYGSTVTPDEVKKLLCNFGKLTECRPATQTEMASNNLGEGVVVNFDMFENGKNACQAFRNHAIYNMIRLFHLGASQHDRGQSDPTHRAYLDTYEVDRCSIFVGNLPSEINDLEVKDIFSKYGDIINITTYKNESNFDPFSKHCFAFVQFTSQSSVNTAITELNCSLLRGRTIRVSQKDSETARARARYRHQITRPQGHNITSTYQNSAMALQNLNNSVPFLAPFPACQSQFGSFGYAPSGYANSYYLDPRGQYWITPSSPYTYSYGSPVQVSPFPNSQYQNSPIYGYSGPHGLYNYNWHQTQVPVCNSPNLPTMIPKISLQPCSQPISSAVSQSEGCLNSNPSGHTIVDSSMEFVE